MVLILRNTAQHFYKECIVERDMGMAHLPFMGSVWAILLVVAAYLAFVLKIGPAYMKNRPPYELKWFMLLYNFLQIAINAWIGGQALYSIMWYHPYDVGCMMPLPPQHQAHHIELRLVYSFYLLKLLDLLDTVLFVLRKRFRQVSFLHVYHHVIVVVTIHFVFRCNGYGGHTVAMGTANMVVHFFMYIYYLLSALSGQVKRSLWWKKYLTLFQMAQFIFLTVFNAWPIVMRPDCKYPHSTLIAIILQSVVMFVLFANFYRKAYMGKRCTTKRDVQKERIE